MTLSANSIEELVKLRDSMYNTITNLQMGLLAEKKKADEFEFFRNDKNFDKAAMDAQSERSLENARAIQLVLDAENEKLNDINKQIQSLTGIVIAHGSQPCLIGAIPHSWNVLARHPSGKFAHRKCIMCNADEKVGYC